MRSIIKVSTRFVISSAIITIILFIANIVFALAWFSSAKNYNFTEYNLSKIALNLVYSNNAYILNQEGKNILDERYQWAMLLNNDGKLIWSYNFPDDLPKEYSLQQVAVFSKWYLNDYPIHTYIYDDKLLVFGKSKASYAKYNVELPASLLDNFTSWSLGWLILNILFILLFSLALGIWLVHTFKPLAKGIYDLAENKKVELNTTNIMGDLALSINKASVELQNQKIKLQQRDAARANWIRGISHDIRTPLSMILGYASELEENNDLEIKKQANIIQNQVIKIKQLVNDLNLTSKLEYEMQPLNWDILNLSELIRNVIVEFLNGGLDNIYNISFNSYEKYLIEGDSTLIKRAISNLIQNSINHNPLGCNINLYIKSQAGKCSIYVVDDGLGVSDEKLDILKYSSHYITNSGTEQHGLGLQIVKQIVKVHGGIIEFSSPNNKGLCVQITFPTLNNLEL